MSTVVRELLGEGDHGFVSRPIGIVRSTGLSGYRDDGRRRWATFG